MPTRRQTTVGLASAALGSAVVSSASVFAGGSATSADLRVVVSSDLTLTPGRAGAEYVQTDGDDEVEAIVIQQLNQRSISRFERLVEVTNNGDVPYDRLAFSFAPVGDDPDGSSTAVAETLRVVSADESTTTDAQGRTTLLAPPDETFAPGDAITFGMVVNLIAGDAPGTLDDLPEESNIALEIVAIDSS